MKVALYLRCSTSKQDLESQRREVVAWAGREGHTYSLYEDQGISGFKADREGVTRLLHDARSGAFQAVAVWELSRLGRSMGQITTVIEELSALGIVLFETKSNMQLDKNTTAGAAMVGALALAAEIEGRLIRERNERGRKKIKEEHIKVGRKRKEGITEGAVEALRGQGRSIAEIARLLHSNKATVHRRLKESRSRNAHLRNVTESNEERERQEQNPKDSETPFHGGGRKKDESE